MIPPSSSQTEDADIRASLGMSAPATDARSDKQDFLDSILSSMQEQQRLMTFLVERQQQQLTARKHPAVPMNQLPTLNRVTSIPSGHTDAEDAAVRRAPKAIVCYSPRTS